MLKYNVASIFLMVIFTVGCVTQPQAAGLSSCGSDMPFSVSPIAYSDLVQITPLGNLNPSGHTLPTDHMYFNVRGSNKFSNPQFAEQVQVISPGKIHITNIASNEYLSANPVRTDYALDFSPCKEISAKFGHVTSLSQKILDQYKEPFDSCQTYTTGGTTINYCRKHVDILLEPGETIGTAAGVVGGSIGLDFGMTDSRRTPLLYANPSSYRSEQAYFVCPLDYFEPAVKSELYKLVGSYNGTRRTIEPVCGEVDQDKPGTTQGAWFLKGSEKPYMHDDQHLALVHDNTNPSIAVFSVGTSMSASGLNSGTYSFTPASTGTVNRDFSDVSDDKIYCYKAVGRASTNAVIILQLTNAATLRIEKQNTQNCGNGPWTFTASHTDFER